MQDSSILEELILAEVAGKNAAIHTYDGIIWKIRSGYLTLLFAAWSVLLNSIADDPNRDVTDFGGILWAMVIFSAGLAVGACMADFSYVRRKFRVILGLNELMREIAQAPDDLKGLSQEHLKVTGDDGDMPYRSPGYRQARRAGACVFFAPLAALALAVWAMLGL